MENITGPAPRVDHTDDVTSPPASASHPTLPFDEPHRKPLPFDDEVDVPIGFALTARARRTVAPDSLPALSVIGGTADQEDASDTRPARARALRRAGVTVPEIGRQLGVDTILVQAWVADLPSSRSRPATRAARAAAVLAAPAASPAASPAVSSDAQDRGDAAKAAGPCGPDPDPAWTTARHEAASDGRRRLEADAGFAGGLGLLAGIATIDRHAIGFSSDRVEVAGRLVHWLVAEGGDARDVRVVLRLGRRAAGDLARHRWAATLGITTEQIAVTRWRHAPHEEAVDAFVRIRDASLAARTAGWCDALLRPVEDPADVAF